MLGGRWGLVCRGARGREYRDPLGLEATDAQLFVDSRSCRQESKQYEILYFSSRWRTHVVSADLVRFRRHIRIDGHIILWFAVSD